MNYFLDKLGDFLKFLEKSVEKNHKTIAITLFVLILANLLFFPTPGLAKKSENIFAFEQKLVWNWENTQKLANLIKIGIRNKGFKNRLPESNDLEVEYTKNIVITAYNSEIGQCDASPCITANGFNVCKHGKEDTIAINGLKFGTKVKIPALFGDRVFVVRDRMNSRYDSGRADIWMINKTEAIQFGVKYAQMEILDS